MAAAADEVEVPPAAGEGVVDEHGPELPPYTEADVIADGVKCYKCDGFTTTSWKKLMEHLRRQHGIQWGTVKGTYLHSQARRELNESEREKYEAKKQKQPAASKRGPTEGGRAGVAVAQGAPAELKRNRDDTCDGWSWKAMWVKVGLDGFPVWPLQVRDMTGSDSSHSCPQQGHQLAAASAPPDQPAVAAQVPPAAPVATQGEPAKLAPSGGDWVSKLPKVSIKSVYLDAKVPEPSSHGGRALWPVELQGFKPEMPAFVSYLANDKNQGHAAQEDVLRGLTRLYHMLEVDGVDLNTGDEACHARQRSAGSPSPTGP